jgi:hypothetical protein
MQKLPPKTIGIVEIIQGSLEVKLPTIWTDGKAKVGRVRESERVRRTGKGRKAAKHRVFPMICG